MTKRNGFTKDNITRFFEQGIDLEGRIIYIGSAAGENSKEEGDPGITFLSSEYVIKGLEVLNRVGRGKIVAVLNSVGGNEGHGFAIYDAIRASRAPVDVEVLGSAMSMGAIILQAGRRRLLHPHATIMIHDGTMGFDREHTRNIQRWSEYSKKTAGMAYNIFAERSGKSPAYWKGRCAHDSIYCAQGAVDVGLADAILQPTRKLPLPPTKKR